MGALIFLLRPEGRRFSLEGMAAISPVKEEPELVGSNSSTTSWWPD